MFESVFLLALCSAGPQHEAAKILQAADRYRLDPGAIIVSTEVTLYEGEEVEKTRRYQVFVKPGRKTLVEFKTPGE